ncbi:hypothetical protein JX265_013031 [Neoarthrinium moseri]|uniref:Rhodopsin domain-containing protein n=1 Tax=Neoarthrinium moseri TaxID=1658444 RepID=A0A9Q0AI02_9PEZI|nr:hypothetical protein JX265_013031 [Neoarthrinium moseri]
MVVARVGPLFVTSILFTTLSFLVVALRFYSRFFVLHYAGVDDYLMIGSLCASIGFMIVVVHQIEFGLGTHFESIPPELRMRFFQSLWATIPVYNLSLVLCKLSIIFQYKRVFGTTMIQRTCNIMIGVLAVYGCWTVIGSALMCIPVQFFWGVGEGVCMNRLAFWFSNAALNIASDIFIFAIPVPLIRKLQVSNTQKLILLVVFAFGLFVCVTSIVRLKSLLTISVSNDSSFDGVDIAVWSGIEINVAIICASVPALKPLVNSLFPKLLGSTPRSKGQSRSGYTNQNDSHHMKSLQSRVRKETVIEQTFELREDLEGRLSNSGSERELVAWSASSGPSNRKGEEAKSREMV